MLGTGNERQPSPCERLVSKSAEEKSEKDSAKKTPEKKSQSNLIKQSSEKPGPEKPSPDGPASEKIGPRSHDYETKSSEGTVAIGRKLADLLTPPRLLILSGDLGAGKTTLVKGIATALGAAEADEVTSPTFNLIHEYSGTVHGAPGGKPIRLLHLDLYRLDAERQLDPLGLEELQTPDALVLIEWGEKFKSIEKRATGKIVIKADGGDARKITLTIKP